MSELVKPTMLLITSAWGDRKTFKLIPVSADCPFVEGIFEGMYLVMIAKDKKNSVAMLPKLDENGDRLMRKRDNGKDHKEERVHIETYAEHLFLEKPEIIDFIKMICVNADTFDYNKFMGSSDIIKVEMPQIIH
jgi:hypothetical protein